MAMSRITAGEVEVSVNGKDYVLKPTLRAAQLISRNFGGYAQARAQLASETLEAATYILRVGSGLPDKELKDLDDQVWKNGMTAELILPLMRYVAVLGNGGRPLPDDNNALSGDGGSDSSGNE